MHWTSVSLLVAIAAIAAAARCEAFLTFSPCDRTILSKMASSSSTTRFRTTKTPTARRVSSSGSSSSWIEGLPGPDDVTEENIRSLFYLWNDALATGESRIVAKRYAKDAVFLPAVSDEPRMDYDSIKKYYDDFLLKGPQKEVVEGRIRIGHGWAEDAGICEITLRAEDNARMRARYSFVYVWEDNRWKIVHHHSSVMPEEQQTRSLPTTPAMTVERVQNLFQLWNDALDTNDADAVARRFSKSALVFPTNSQTPLTDTLSIQNYFTDFLRQRPHFRIIDSYITIGPDFRWAKDVGTYELTLRTDGTKVMCRYSFDYALEVDGRWKITHHQSSPVPDTLIPTASETDRVTAARMYTVSTTNEMTEADVQGLFTKWNDAMATGDSRVVAQQYSKEAVMVSSISDTPRTNPQAIKEFYDMFLLSKPNAKNLQRSVTVHNHWCKDVGTLEYSIGGSPSSAMNPRMTMKERYSFLYILEDGEWKIAHHHSSIMPPEGLQTNNVGGGRATGRSPSDSPEDDKTPPDAWL